MVTTTVYHSNGEKEERGFGALNISTLYTCAIKPTIHGGFITFGEEEFPLKQMNMVRHDGGDWIRYYDWLLEGGMDSALAKIKAMATYGIEDETQEEPGIDPVETDD